MRRRSWLAAIALVGNNNHVDALELAKYGLGQGPFVVFKRHVFRPNDAAYSRNKCPDNFGKSVVPKTVCCGRHDINVSTANTKDAQVLLISC